MNCTQPLSRAGRARLRSLLAIAAALALAALAPAAGAAESGSAELNAGALEAARQRPTANQLLRQAVANEKLAAEPGYYAWRDRVERRRGSVTKLMVMTPEGILSRTLAIDDRALSAEERRKDDARIDRLLDPHEMREKARKQKEDEQRVERLLRALPDAFDCRYQPAPLLPHLGATVAFLACSPRPQYSPPNYESQVLTGMQAMIAIDLRETRMTSFEGTLFKDVSFAWGFLARLNRGGRIVLRQEMVAGAHWGLTRMELDFDGRLVMVKPLHVKERESAWNYRAVPAMSVAEALDYLRRAPEAAPLPAR